MSSTTSEALVTVTGCTVVKPVPQLVPQPRPQGEVVLLMPVVVATCLVLSLTRTMNLDEDRPFPDRPPA